MKLEKSIPSTSLTPFQVLSSHTWPTAALLESVGVQTQHIICMKTQPVYHNAIIQWD